MRRLPKLFVALVLAFVATLGAIGADLAGGPTAHAACTMSSSLRLGSSGEPVRCLQTTLNALGFNAGPVDGRYGPVTYRAVVRYQQAKGLFVDGVAGRQTATSLGIWGAGAGTTAGGGTTAPTPAPAPNPSGCAINAALRIGSTGAGVQCVQSALAGRGFRVGPIDGKFGNMTRAAVVGFQRTSGLLADGVVGRSTATSLGIWGTPSGGGGTGASPAPVTGPAPSARPRLGCRTVPARSSS